VISLLATGDVGAKRDDLASMFSGCRDVLQQGDVVFGQLETTVTDRGARAPNARLAMRTGSGMAMAAREAGFGVMSFAGNHCLDWGDRGFADTLRHMETAGVALCGAGNTLAEAQQPVVIENGGVKIAFLACSSILPEGYRATAQRPGCMPLRAHTFYEPVEYDQPGTPPRIISRPHRGDLANLLAAIEQARTLADIAIVSIHWGLHMVEADIAEYQRIVAHAVIDAGAHALLGHHPHILKGVEVYRGAPIFYSLGNFAIEQPHIWDPEITGTESFRHLASLNPDWGHERVYMLPEDTRMTGVARLRLNHSGVQSIEFLPAWTGDDSVPRMLAATDHRFIQIRDYLEKISRSQGFETQFRVTEGHLRINQDPSGNQEP